MSLYRHLGVAVALSPRTDALLAETALHGPMMAAKMSLVHAGGRTADKEDRLRVAMRRSGIAEDTEIIWVEGDPDSAILDAVKEHHVDLLLAGALEKEQPLRYFLGSVAHNLVREASCSLLLLTEPSGKPAAFRRIVLITDNSEQSLIALTKAIRLAEKEGSERLTVVRVLSDFGRAMLLSEGVRRERASKYPIEARTQEEEILRNLIDAAGRSTVPIEAKCIEGHTGYVASHFAREHDADLLVMPSTGRHRNFLERLFPSDMEWVLREIPCNLWVVREQLS